MPLLGADHLSLFFSIVKKGQYLINSGAELKKKKAKLQHKQM